MLKKIDKRLVAITIILIVLNVLIYFGKFPNENVFNSILTLPLKNNTTCVYSTEERTIRGTSMSGIFNANETINVMFGYYGCTQVKRNDVIVYNRTGRNTQMIKIVKGVPEDKFRLGESKEDNGWKIIINDQPATNSQGIDYILGSKGHQMLSLYENDYNGIIPKDTYLILGNEAKSPTGSTEFGLIDISSIIGKVVI